MCCVIDSAVLDMPVADLEFSNRTRNVIMRHFPPRTSPTLRDLAEISEGKFLASQGCGRKSINEIKSRLSEMGLELGTVYTGGAVDVSLNTPDIIEQPEFPPSLFSKLQDFEWSVRTRNGLNYFYPNFEISSTNQKRPALIGDLIMLSRPELLEIQNMGRKSIAEIESVLSVRNLSLRMKIPGWNEDAIQAYLAENRRDLDKERKDAALAKYLTLLPSDRICLEDEIMALISYAGITNQRNIDMFLRNTGLDGKGGSTLEEIGQSYGVTRERVRQIVKKDKNKFRDGISFKLDVFEKIIAHLSTITCESTQSIESAIVEKGFTRHSFELNGLFELEKIVNPPTDRLSDLEIDRLPGTDIWYLFRGDMRKNLRAIRLEIKRQSSNQGYAKISDVLSFCLEKSIDISQNKLISALKETDDLRFLNSEEDAFVIVGVRNRLFNGISKCLLTHRPLKAVRIKDGLRRYARLTQIPTTSELLEFSKIHPDLRAEDNQISWSSEFDFSDIASDAETQFINAFDDASEIMTFKALQAKCLRQGMNPTTFYLYTRQLPCLESDGYGRFALRGCPGDPFNLDRSSAGFSGEASLQTLRNMKEGVTQEGHYWLAFVLDDKISKSGAFIASSRLTELLNQPRNIESISGEFYGKTALIGQGVSGFKQAFLANGAEEGDMIIVVYNVDQKKVMVALGSDDQLETAKSASYSDLQDGSEMVDI